MPTPMGDRICERPRLDRALRTMSRPASATGEQRLRGKALARHHLAASRGDKGSTTSLRRLAEGKGKVGRTAQGAPTVEWSSYY